MVLERSGLQQNLVFRKKPINLLLGRALVKITPGYPLAQSLDKSERKRQGVSGVDRKKLSDSARSIDLARFGKMLKLNEDISREEPKRVVAADRWRKG